MCNVYGLFSGVHVQYYNSSDNFVYQINGVISLLSVYNINIIYYGHAVLSLYIHVCGYYLGG